MSEMTREHLEAVRLAASDMRAEALLGGWGSAMLEVNAARLSEVAAMIEAKLESRDEG